MCVRSVRARKTALPFGGVGVSPNADAAIASGGGDFVGGLPPFFIASPQPLSMAFGIGDFEGHGEGRIRSALPTGRRRRLAVTPMLQFSLRRRGFGFWVRGRRIDECWTSVFEVRHLKEPVIE